MEEMDLEKTKSATKQATPKVESPQIIESRAGSVASTVPIRRSANTVFRAGAAEDDDTANEVELSPPPDSSSVSSVNPDMLGDEIIVGMHANGHKRSPALAHSDHDDEEMADRDGDEEPVTAYPKRKRSTIYTDLGEDKMDGIWKNGVLKGGDDADALPKSLQKRFGSAHVKGIVLGYWRDSPVPQDKDKHAVIGFIDVRDRLRTRIQCHTRAGDAINSRLFPIPPGPGGSWVTFERIVFDDHLIGLDHNEVKEYVKIRTEAAGHDESPHEKQKAEIAAVEEAKRRLELNPPTEANQQPSIAWGKDLPEYLLSGRPEKRRRTNGSAAGTMSAGSPVVPPQQGLPQPPPQQHSRGISPLPGTRPTRILVGCWTKSDAEDDMEKHAVFGILGANDMFRVKLMRETMDGRYHNGNFPTGAGALWIAYEEVKFLPHLQNLTRPEMKEYVRVRQSQMDAGETDEERVANETQAVYEAQRRAALMAKNPALRQSTGPADREDGQETPKTEPRGQEPQQDRRDTIPPPDPRPARHSLPEPAARHGSQRGSIDVERQRGIVSRTIDRMELNQVRDERNATQRASAQNTPPAHDVRRDFNDNLQRMDRIWQAQELSRQGPSNDNIKIHAGIKYERKRGGPFEGKLVSQGTIISIDGEDYVEYRVLTKPSFF
ncbi:hypothetical protein DL770_005632 [Monosporascus sp. CRB-9-2]|nr:hypothetical protein DL770_005632 [Monosporascus sp. CRB-9-2]